MVAIAMRIFHTNDNEAMEAKYLIDREVRVHDRGTWTRTGIIVGETYGGRLVVRWDGDHRTTEIHNNNRIVIFGRRDNRELLESFTADLSAERAELQAAASAANSAADRLQKAAHQANEAASWISSEASRLRRV